jgi:hypothetical protein
MAPSVRPILFASWALLAVWGCSGRPTAAQAIIAEGRAEWAARKMQCPAYHYDRDVQGPRGEILGLMTVQVVDDRPAWRSFFGGIDASWFEDAAALGTHDGAPAAATVDDLWLQCSTLLSRGDATPTRLPVNEEGVLMFCMAALDSDVTVGPLPEVSGLPFGYDGVRSIRLEGCNCDILEPPVYGGDSERVDAATD